jgi:hypothetical protein
MSSRRKMLGGGGEARRWVCRLRLGRLASVGQSWRGWTVGCYGQIGGSSELEMEGRRDMAGSGGGRTLGERVNHRGVG